MISDESERTAVDKERGDEVTSGFCGWELGGLERGRSIGFREEGFFV